MCFGIAKLWYLSLHNWVFLFSFLYAHAWCAQKEKYAKKIKIKSKKNQNAFKYGCKHVSTRCGSYTMYLKSNGPHQTVMIVCECIWFSYIITLHIMWHLCFLAKVSHTTRILFATLDTIVQVQCDLVITRDTYSSISLLNYHNLFLKRKLVRLV